MRERERERERRREKERRRDREKETFFLLQLSSFFNCLPSSLVFLFQLSSIQYTNNTIRLASEMLVKQSPQAHLSIIRIVHFITCQLTTYTRNIHMQHTCNTPTSTHNMHMHTHIDTSFTSCTSFTTFTTFTTCTCTHTHTFPRAEKGDFVSLCSPIKKNRRREAAAEKNKF